MLEDRWDSFATCRIERKEWISTSWFHNDDSKSARVVVVELLLSILLSCCSLGVLVWWGWRKRTADHGQTRKKTFLQSAEAREKYCGGRPPFEAWRRREFPGLIQPISLGSWFCHKPSTGIVYLDYAGAALPTQSQMEQICKCSTTVVLANPHSTGPAASVTKNLQEQVRTMVLDHFCAQPTRWHTNTTRGVGYDLLFTSGTTESMRIVAERLFDGGAQLAYAKQSHTSVLGMRGTAMGKNDNNVDLICKPIQELIHDFETRAEWTQSPTSQRRRRRLLVLPLECNFTGERFRVEKAIENASALGWYVFLDIAKAAATGPVHLNELNPDFAAVSFYKMFGEPTGLGALFVKRSSLGALDDAKKNDTIRRYFGGGSVDIVVPGSTFAVPRSEPTVLASMSSGTVHFRGIAALRFGFEEIHRYGGMQRIHSHVTCLAQELVHRLRKLKHGNGTSAVQVYGQQHSTIVSCPGSVVSFNVFRSDGNPVGFNDVSKLAALNTPPIQLRTGCFCNPGACQEVLGISNEEMIRRYRTEGHVCGGSLDLIDGKVTGAIRASFGKESLWEDLDALVVFLQRTFVEQSVPLHSTKASTHGRATTAMISELYIFPIKSCAAQRVREWPLDKETGRFVFDREFALVDSSGSAMRLQTYPCLTQLCPRIDLHSMVMILSAPGRPELVIDLTQDLAPYRDSNDIRVCGNKCGAVLWDDGVVSAWCSAFVGVKCWLARFSKPMEHERHEKGIVRLKQVAFANECPLLLLSEQSVECFNASLEAQGKRTVTCLQFRPNIVIRYLYCKEAESLEDDWKIVKPIDSSNAWFNVVGQCARCAMVDFHPETGGKGDVFRSLAKFRQSKGRITFGVFLQLAAALSDDECLKEGNTVVCS